MPQYKDDKRGTWYFRIRKRDIYGNVRQITRRGFNSKGEAKDAEARELLKPLEEKYDMSLNDLWDKYIAYKKPRVKEATIITIEERYTRHVKNEIGNLKVKSMSVNKYMEYQNILLNKGLGINYINNIHGDISSALKFGQKFLNVDKNVANLVGPLKDNKMKTEKTVWSSKDFKKFMDYCLEILYKTNDYMLIKSIAMIISSYVLGFRVGEGQALTYKKIDFKSASMLINEAYSPFSKKITLPKNKASVRYISIPKNLINIYKHLYELDKRLDGFNKEWFIFGNIKPMSRTTLKRYRDDLCIKAGVPVVTNHELRHSQASYLTNSGLNRQAIAEMLGHSPEILLTTYSHTFQSTNDEILAKQNQLFE